MRRIFWAVIVWTLAVSGAQAALYALGPPSCNCVFKTDTRETIPLAGTNYQTNPAYVAYQAWLAVPNTPDPWVAPPPTTRIDYNFVLNGQGIINQKAATFVNMPDSSYVCDIWNAMRETTDTGNTASCGGAVGSGPLVGTLALGAVNGTTSQRLAVSQTIENADTNLIRSRQVTYQANFQPSGTFNLRLAVLAWTGTANQMPANQINNWSSTSYVTGGFFKSTTLTVVCVSASIVGTANLPVAGSCSGTVPTGATNVQVMVWSEAALASNANFYHWGHNLNPAGETSIAVGRNYTQELMLVQRHYEVANVAAYVPAFASSQGVANVYSYKVKKRTPGPAISFTGGTATVQNSYDDWMSYLTGTTAGLQVTIDARIGVVP